MRFANMTTKKIQRILKIGLVRFRRLVLWIPMLALITGTAISVYIYDNLRAREREILKTDSIQRYKEMINQLDLLFSNSILRIQSYEEYLGSRLHSYKSDAVFMRQALSYTMFQRFSIFEYTHKNEKGTNYPEMRMLAHLDTKDSLLESLPASYKLMTSEIVKEGLKRMMEGSTPQKIVLHNYNETPRVSFIMRSRGSKDVFYVFTAPLVAVFAKTDLRLGESLDVTDSETGSSWKVEAKDNNQKTVRPNTKTAVPSDLEGYRHYLYVEGLPQSGMKLNFAFNFKEPKKELSPAVIAGLMSFLMTLVISYLFLVLVRQNSLVTKLVIEKTTDLEKAHHELQEVLLGKTRFLGNISHEIRTPLNLILGMIDLCEEEDKDKKITAYLKSMRASGNHLLSMIEDLLDLAKADSNDLQIHYKKINLIQLLDEISRIAGQDIMKKNLRFYTHFAADLPVSIQCDPSRLRQILMNLLRNASKYTSQGHVVFRVSRTVGAGSRSTLRFEVEDTGIGIPEDKLGRIFDAFFQIEGSYALAEGGVGLGLAIVKELVRRLGGTLTVQSKAKRGSTFCVDLEVESPEAAPWLETYKPADGKSVELLVVSRDPQWRDSLTRLSQHSQIHLNHVLPEEAKNYLASHSQKEPRWILVDAMLAGFSMALVRHDDKVGRVMVAGQKKNLMDAAADPQVAIVDNSPLLVSEVLSAMGFINRPRKRLEKKESVATAAMVPPVGLSEKQISLIVADDDIGNKELYMAYFEKTPWNVEFAMNGKEAWDLYLEKPSDVLVLDLRMPIMDGFEVVEKVRAYEQQNNLPSKPILLVTADALDATAEKALSLPKVSFLTKPIKKSVLFNSIQKVLN
jgi:signal transduction histidine kinase/CheY-like chemotaxis protein